MKAKSDISLGEAVRARRLELSLTQEELAARSALHRTYISDIERGNRNISLQSIAKIADALELSLSDFFAHYYEED